METNAMNRFIRFSTFFLALVATLATAGTALTLDLAKGDFPGQRAAIEKTLAEDKAYREGTSDKFEQITQSFDGIAKLLGGQGGIDGLDAGQRDAAMKLQAQANEVISTIHRDSRIVCQRRNPTGSQIPKSFCMTAAAWERDARNSQELMRNMQAPVPQTMKSN